MLTQDWLKLAEYEEEKFAEELVGEEGDRGIDGESDAKTNGQKDLIVLVKKEFLMLMCG